MKTINSAGIAASTDPAGVDVPKLTGAWLNMWNGDVSLIVGSVSTGFLSHAASLMGGPAMDTPGREALGLWITGIHSILPDLRFTVEIGPISEADFVVLRWKAQGTYNGKFPGASQQATGTTVTFYGTDTLRITEGLITEYWANADSLWFLQQLGVTAVPPL
jgi:hypothetical protein